jgi:uncharacterized protein
MNDTTTISSPPAPLAPEVFDRLDTLLDDLRTRYEETPQWEFCEGFMAALICCRRLIPASEYLPVLLGLGEDGAAQDENSEEGSFADAGQAEEFMSLWHQRWNEVVASLQAPVESLEDEAAYNPEVMDVRGAVAALPPEERAAMADEALPSFAQVWALGFMFAVENWPEEWVAPRDKEAAQALDQALDAIVTLTDDDEGVPEISVFSDEGPPSVSLVRLNAFGDAIWAVYELSELWRSIGPRVETVHRAPTPGRNEACFCGSGKKYKKCHGAT